MNDIANAIERLAHQAEHEDDPVRIWAVAALAIRLGVVAVLAEDDDPVEAVAEIGEIWAGMVTEVMDEHPGQRAEVMSAAQKVIRRVLDAVQAKGHHPTAPHP
jgi:hypothetical protein